MILLMCKPYMEMLILWSQPLIQSTIWPPFLLLYLVMTKVFKYSFNTLPM